MWSSGESILGRGTTSAEVADVRSRRPMWLKQSDRGEE